MAISAGVKPRVMLGWSAAMAASCGDESSGPAGFARSPAAFAAIMPCRAVAILVAKPVRSADPSAPNSVGTYVTADDRSHDHITAASAQ